MVLIHTEIDINAPPAKVRDVFHDFASWPDWSNGMIKAVSSHKHASEVKVGETLEVVLQGMTIEPILLVNDDIELKWRGNSLNLLMGDHGFKFEESKTTPGGTTFVHEEEFYRLLGVIMMLPFGLYGKTKMGFEAFNEDLKKRVEGGN